MKLIDYLNKNVRITNNKGYSFDGYVSEFFRGEDNDDGIDSIGVSRDSKHLGGIEISENEIKSIVVI
mgnify:CR=1 FL=1|nr:MAG TPA: hypothetical protein [Caudoviricetes sp.]